MRLKGKVAIVTGAASGIGRATAELFAAEGARVMCADIQADAVRETARRAGHGAIASTVDVLQPQDIERMVAETIAAFGRLDVLYANAGIAEATNAIDSSDRQQLFWLVGAILLAAVLRLGLTVIRRIVAGRVSLAVEFDLRQEVYAHLMSLELGFFDRNQTGQLMSRATVDLQSIRFFLGYGLIFFSQSLLTVLLAGVVMFVINPWLALIALAPTPLIVFTALRYTRQSRPAMQEVAQRVAELTAQAEESVSGIRVVKAFAREDHQFERFQGAVDRLFDQSIRSTRIQAFFSPLIAALPQLGTALVLLVGGHEVLSGNLDLGQFTAFYVYMLMLAGPLRTVGMALGMGQRAIASGNRLFEVLDREPELFSKPGAGPLPEGGGAVRFDDVSLSYGPEAPDALQGIDLEVPAGTRIALVGPSGAGKTSLAALLARLYDPTGGSVSIDGADLREVDLPSLRHQIAYVSDDSFLFSDTIAENISYARPDATRDEIERAARLAQASEFTSRVGSARSQVGRRETSHQQRTIARLFHGMPGIRRATKLLRAQRLWMS